MRCNFCESTEFRSVGLRAYAQCANCGSRERHRTVLSLFNDILRDKSKRILHFTPNIAWARIFKEHPYYTVMRYDLRNIPIQSDTMDVVIASHIMEHICMSDDLALEEIYRILKPNGLAIISVPIQPESKGEIYFDANSTDEEREKELGHRDHYNGYTKQSYRAKLIKAGFFKSRFIAIEKEVGQSISGLLDSIPIAYK